MVSIIQNLLAYYIKRILKGTYKKNHQNWSNIKLLTYKNRKNLLWHHCLKTGSARILQINPYLSVSRIIVLKFQKDLSTKTIYCTETTVSTNGQQLTRFITEYDSKIFADNHW